MSLILFILVIFEVGTRFCPELTWIMTLLFMLPIVPRMTGVHHHTQPLLVEIESPKLVAWAGLELRSFQSPPPE
jgi:hypothetical protein